MSSSSVRTLRTRPTGRKTRVAPRRGLRKGVSFWDRTRTSQVYRNLLPQLPDEFDTCVVSGFIWASAGATASVTGNILSNTLLSSSHTITSLTQNTYLDDIARSYAEYRVVAYQIEYEWVSRSTVDSNFSVQHVNEDPAWSTAASFSSSSVTMNEASFCLVPSTTKYPNVGRVHTKRFNLADIVASSTFQNSDTYSGTISATGVFTDPSDLTYVSFYAGQVTGAAYTANNAPYLFGRLKQYVKLYARRQ